MQGDAARRTDRMVDAGADAPARTGTDSGSLDAAEHSPPPCPSADPQCEDDSDDDERNDDSQSKTSEDSQTSEGPQNEVSPGNDRDDTDKFAFFQADAPGPRNSIPDRLDTSKRVMPADLPCPWHEHCNDKCDCMARYMLPKSYKRASRSIPDSFNAHLRDIWRMRFCFRAWFAFRTPEWLSETMSLRLRVLKIFLDGLLLDSLKMVQTTFLKKRKSFSKRLLID